MSPAEIGGMGGTPKWVEQIIAAREKALPEKVEKIAARVLAEHFVMWHEIGTRAMPSGEWRCSCGKKFGFSDTAIEHQAAEIAREQVTP